jgi:hypothetical protein
MPLPLPPVDDTTIVNDIVNSLPAG